MREGKRSVPVAKKMLVLAALLVAGCGEGESGPVRVSAVGEPPRIVNPNLQELDSASAFLLEAVAQGLVRFDAAGEIEPALAQSWIVSDDGLRYTFRIRRATWSDGSRVTAQQVTARLQAAMSRASQSPLKPVLGAIAEVEAMTDQVLEISLKGPRPYFLQLLAQPEMALIHDGRGTGPYMVTGDEAGALSLSIPESDEEDEDPLLAGLPDIELRGEPALRGIARFAEGRIDLFAGGTLGSLPLARAAGIDTARIAFDPTAGMFGLLFTDIEGALGDVAVRNAISMAIDRDAIASALAVPEFRPRLSLVQDMTDDLESPALPEWAASPMPMRRELAARTIAGLEEPLRLRVAMPIGPGYRILFAYLRRDWRLIGVEAERVRPGDEADLRLVDNVAPGHVASWYLRHFTCDARQLCDPLADEALEAARVAPDAAQRGAALAAADQLLTNLTPFVPIAAPVRWSLVSTRLTGFRPNAFAHHPAGTLIAQE